MNQQLNLFQSPEPLPHRYRLFLGIFPDDEAVQLIGEQQTTGRNKFGLRGKPRPRGHLPVTLHHLGDYRHVPEPVVDLTTQACVSAFASQPSLGVTFDHVKSFRGQPGHLPFVLINPSGNAALLELHRRLITELAKYRLAGRGDFDFVPHVTMLYDRLNVPEQPICPVRWPVNEVVLILSHVGATKYERLGCWTLSE